MNTSLSMPAWQVLLVDDDPDVHEITQLVLMDLTFSGRKIQFHSVYSGEECKAHLAAHPDTALVLLDVVMETDDAGLATVRYIREQLRNADLQIVLRTGHPGLAPEREVITGYEINGYFLKTELTAQKLTSVVIGGLRTYQYVKALQQANALQPEGRPLAAHHAPDLSSAAAASDAGVEAAIEQSLRSGQYRLQAVSQFDLGCAAIAAIALLPEWPVPDGWMPHTEIAGSIRRPALITEINAALLRRACEFAQAWHADPQAAMSGPSRVSVPILLPQVAGAEVSALLALPELLRQYLRETGQPGNVLDLQLPITMLGTATEAARLACARIQEQGASVTLADVGNTPISLANLQRLLPDRLQIPLGYVRNVAADAKRAAIARAVIALAHTLGMQVLANGLASTDELQFFKWEGCDHGQGDVLGAAWETTEWMKAVTRK
ncbi:two-component response regulator modulated Metal-dependent phosphohydrolase, HD region [Cupriavidus sp. GA3-3]|uniref:EAL domain-containing response regulator n=1 Tax=Cupriavidus sp. GA3-3 TaxID=1229514 RepID=UPI00032ECE4C|nr:EAL domain-containing protein [Cupriavidus sp. GA3-3]EON18803.1 two-component response regulator modulated Metal-dependent phosphohydrolase, HD region [Cupriavidus sp. GA3-3]